MWKPVQTEEVNPEAEGTEGMGKNGADCHVPDSTKMAILMRKTVINHMIWITKFADFVYFVLGGVLPRYCISR